MTARFIASGGGPAAPGGGSGPNPTDAFSLNIKTTDSVPAPMDAASFVMHMAFADSVPAPTDALNLGVGFADTVAAPADASSFRLRYWLSGSTGTSHVTNPANANGQNDGTSSTQQTAAAGAATETLTSACGVNIPAATAFATAIYRGWFVATVPLVTSTVKVVARSTSALFADVTMFTTTASSNHSTGDFTFDLIAAGINTLAKLRSVQILHSTTDAIAGTTPAVLTVDAGAIELTGVF